MDIFERLANKIISRVKNWVKRLRAYLRRLLFPLYFFPVKLATYSAYYTVKLVLKTVIAFLKVIWDSLVFPFKSLKNFLKSLFVAGVVVYMLASLFVITDYLKNEYGWYGKFLCSIGAQTRVENAVVRIVGGYSEGSGFFTAPNQVLTNFHVIADEPSPKIIFPDGSFITPESIIGDPKADLALLFTGEHYPEMVLDLPQAEQNYYPDEQMTATGYAMGTELTGAATAVRGRFVDLRPSRGFPFNYLQTDINLVDGMSGGPLTDRCGRVVGINTMGLAGLSLFISAAGAHSMIPYFTDEEIIKIEVDPAASPEEAVRAFYTYLKARRMEEGFALLSREYLKKTDFEEWTGRFTDILDVEIVKAELAEGSDDTVEVKFGTKNWFNNEAEYHYYEGTWQTVEEDGVYKMLKSNIKEVEEPGWEWFYE